MKYVPYIAAALAGAGLFAHGGAPAQAADPATEAPVIAQSSVYPSLDIVTGAIPQAPPGRLLTLTVDGIERPLLPGHYVGDVRLTVTDDIPVQYRNLPMHHFRTALYVVNGAPVASRSVLPALGEAVPTAGRVDRPVIVSTGERFNGIIVGGDGRFTIDHPVIDFEGNGGNDFAGFGAAIMSTDKAEVIVERPIIRTRGAIRTALFVGGASTMRVRGAEIEVRNGTLPAGYTFTIDVGRMMEVPWMLGLSGNVRATNLVGNGTLYLEDSHVRAQGWGALSTDDASRVRMFVKDSLIETIDSGYGSYSIGDSRNVFDHSVIRAADIGSIIAGEGSITFTNATLVDAGRFGVMMHSGTGGGELVIERRSTLRSRETAIEVKGRGTSIVIDDASVEAGNGVLLQAMENDDPFLKAMMSHGGGPIPGIDAAAAGGNHQPAFSPDVIATLRHTRLVGDIYNGRPAQGGMSIRLEDAALQGRISTSRVEPASGHDPTQATFREIGRVTNTPSPMPGHGLSVALDRSARWTVTGTSSLTALELSPGGTIEGAAQRHVRMTIDGRNVPVRPGRYHGAIKLELH